MRGGQRQALMLLEELRRAGNSCQLLARPDGPLWQAASGPAGLRSVHKFSEEADLVHAHDARAHTLCSIAAQKPLVVSRRVAFPPGSGLLSRWKYRRADCFLAVSDFVSRELRRAGVPADKIEVVHDGVDLVELRDEPRRRAPLAVALASRDPQKGRDLAEKAAELAQMTLVFSDDLVRDLRNATQFVYLTRSEGLGSAALLAMSFGLPVIASRIGGLPEVVIDQETGLLVDNDPAEVARAMRRLADDAPFAAQLGRNGRKRVEQFFTRRQMVERTLRAYEKVLELA